MVSDTGLNEADEPEIWAPVHAWRALAQLRAVEAVEPLVEFMKVADDDAVTQEFVTVFGMIGPAAIPALAAVIADPAAGWLPSSVAGGGLAEIGTRHPESREECVGLLVRALERNTGRDPEIVGDIAGDLLQMKAVEAIDAIREAFRVGAVDVTVSGDLEDAEIDLGPREHRTTPKPHYGRQAGLTARRPPARSHDDDCVGWVVDHHHADRAAEWIDARRTPKIRCNDPCPCGSGKKYKKCCLDQNRLLAASSTNNGALH
jgi:hypothetical protein